MKAPEMPPKRTLVDFYDEEDDQEPELKFPPEINDRTKLTIRDAYPNFIITELQMHYYHTVYDQITKNGTVLKSVDTYGLGMLAFNMALVDDCNRAIANFGMNMEYRGDRKMILKRNPALDVLKDAQAAIRFYLKEFSMTPTSRGKVLEVGAGMGDNNDGFDEI